MDQSHSQTNQNKGFICFIRLPCRAECATLLTDHHAQVKKMQSSSSSSKRKLSSTITNFEGLEKGLTVRVPTPQQCIVQQQQVNALLKEARELLTPPDRSPLHLPYLRNGSKFQGIQSSHQPDASNNNVTEYTVTVEMKEVNLAEDYLCGYLTIENLTAEYPTLTTLFEAEVIGPESKSKFRTGHRWRTSAHIDFEHWTKFPAFQDLLRAHGVGGEPEDMDDLCPLNYIAAPGLFMRWKERFLVPDHRIEKIEGASYKGFYYMYYDKRTRTFDGYYYHDYATTTTDKFQRIQLQHCEDKASAYSAFR